jgi:hypothetical protein
MMRVMTVSEVGIESWDNKSVDRFMLPAPSPNPFVRDLRISFSVPRSGALSISVYDIAGRLVSNIVDRNFSAGEYEIVWHGKDNTGRRISSGIYFVRAIYGNEVTTRKVILLTE